jgi:hypothetical protein
VGYVGVARSSCEGRLALNPLGKTIFPSMVSDGIKFVGACVLFVRRILITDRRDLVLIGRHECSNGACGLVLIYMAAFVRQKARTHVPWQDEDRIAHRHADRSRTE